MATPLADIPALEARLGYTLTADELTMAEAALEDASAVVRLYGLPWPDPETAPDIAVQVTIAAALRVVRNPEGYSYEMEGGYQYKRQTGTPLGVDLTAGEKAMLRTATGVGGLFSVPIEHLGGQL